MPVAKTKSNSAGTKRGAETLKAQALKNGDRVAIVAPASRPEGPHVVAAATQIVENMGFVPVVGEHVLSTHGYMAGTDEERLKDLNGFINDKTIRGIFCITGGYGSLRILDHVDYDGLMNDPKVIVGSDENTCLLQAINQTTGLVCFHGFNLDCIKTQEDCDEFSRAVSTSKALPPVQAAPSFPAGFVYAPFPGKTDGIVSGGNFSSFFSLMGTRYQPDFNERILFFEDRNERSDILERWMTALLLSGELENANAILFGNFENCGVRGGYNLLTVEETFLERLQQVRKPCCFNMMIGQSAHCRVIPLGVRAETDTKSGTLTFLEPALL